MAHDRETAMKTCLQTVGYDYEVRIMTSLPWLPTPVIKKLWHKQVNRKLLISLRYAAQ